MKLNRPFRATGNIKLGLFVLAILIITSSLVYTNWLVHRLRQDNERFLQYNAKLLANALATDAQAKEYREERRQFLLFNANLYATALTTESDNLDFVFDEIIRNIAFPVIITVEDSKGSSIYAYRNVEIPAGMLDSLKRSEFLNAEIQRMDSENTPIPVKYLGREIMLIHFGNPAEKRFDILMDEILDAINFPIVITRMIGDSLQIQRHTIAAVESMEPDDQQTALQDFIQRMDSQNDPIGVYFGGRRIFQIHYFDSGIIQALRWFPLIELFLIGSFILLGFGGIQMIRNAERKGLWVGMSKETAHQLGTPLSSLMGWVELLKGQQLAPDASEVVRDMEKDIQRLNQVAERFSKIGAGVKLHPLEVQEFVEPVVQYIQRRIPQWGKTIDIRLEGPADTLVMAHAELMSWALENLLKNAVDAIDGETGEIVVRVTHSLNLVVLEISDNGRGIASRDHRNVFRPGWSSKKRGWGLGLSLVERIIADYHHGSITLSSAPGVGTTFRIHLRPASNP